jgi:hypothetical protein
MLMNILSNSTKSSTPHERILTVNLHCAALQTWFAASHINPVASDQSQMFLLFHCVENHNSIVSFFVMLALLRITDGWGGHAVEKAQSHLKVGLMALPARGRLHSSIGCSTKGFAKADG